MSIHITLDGTIIDVMGFSDEGFGFYQECLQSYQQNIPVADYLKLMQSDNPMMKGHQRITKAVFTSSLFQAVQDLEFRLRINQGMMRAANPSYADMEPNQNDHFYTASEACEAVGVSKTGIIKAIRNGRLAGHQSDNGRWNVSARSLEQYEPDEVRQAARSGK